jgi:NADPH:quinone reductase-like Zn-dependent oxidoreductase
MLALAAPTRDAAAATFRQYTLTRGDGIDRLAWHAQPRRPLADHEVRVRIRAVALNHRDLMLARGTAGVPGRRVVPASDGAGDVVEVGAAVAGLQVGDRVVSTFFPDWSAGPMTEDVAARALGGTLDGVLAEEVVLPASAWVRAPAHLDPAEAATLTCAGVTAWHALFGLDRALPPGGTVALLGTGGVSIWALQLAKAAGLRVILTSSDDDKLRQARQLGADATVNYRATPEWGEAIRALAGGHGVDRVLDVGGPDTVAQSLRALRAGGTVAIIGRLTGTAPAQFDPAEVFVGGKTLAGLMVGSRAMTQDLARFVEAHALRPVIDRRFAFERAADAFAYLAGGRHFGKVVIEVD